MWENSPGWQRLPRQRDSSPSLPLPLLVMSPQAHPFSAGTERTVKDEQKGRRHWFCPTHL